MPDYSGRESWRQKPAPNQLSILFSKPEDLRIALRSIDHSVAGVGPKRMRQLVELVMAVWLCGRQYGCYASRQSLLAVAMRNSDGRKPEIGTLDSLKRTLVEATRLGLIRSVRSHGPSEREVDEARIAKLVRLSRELRRAEKCTTTAPSNPEKCTTTAPSTLLSQNLRTNKPKEPSERSPQLVQAVSDWLAYKAERRQAYKPKGLQVFQSRIDAWVREHGEAAVIADLQRSITSNWSGCGFSFEKNAASLQRKPLNGAVYDPSRSEADYEF